MNLTDVDDKTIGGATAAGQPLRQYVQRFIDAFHEDRRYLRIRDASVYPRATDFIGPMIALVEGLLAKGVAYRGDDGSVYFAIGSLPGVRAAVPARPARAQGRGQRAGECRRIWKGRRARLRALEGRQAGGRGGRRRVGRPVRPGPAGVAPRVLGDGARSHQAAGEPTSRHPCRRSGPDLPASRGRDRAELRVHRPKRSSRDTGCTGSSSRSAARRWRSGTGTSRPREIFGKITWMRARSGCSCFRSTIASSST